MTTQQLIQKLITDGGAIVSSGDCSQMEIADAQSTGRFAVDDDGMGFVLRYKEWLAKTVNDHAAIEHLENLLLHCPHAVITHNDDADNEDRLGMVPVGYSIRVDGCQGLHTSTGKTFREAVAADIAAVKRDQLESGAYV